MNHAVHHLFRTLSVLCIALLGASTLYVCCQPRHPGARPVTPRDAAELGVLPTLARVPADQLNAPLPDARDTLLCVAARFGRTAALELLLSRGADPNVPGPDGTPLMHAARADHPAAVSLLLAHGADPRYLHPDGNDAVQDAVRSHSLLSLDLLLAHGATLARPGMKDNPLSFATRPDELPLAQLLLSLGADPTLPGRDHLTPLDLATHDHSPDLINLLRTHTPAQTSSLGGRAPSRPSQENSTSLNSP